MSTNSLIDIKDKLKKLMINESITKEEYDSIIQKLDLQTIDPDELNLGYLGYIEGMNRHK